MKLARLLPFLLLASLGFGATVSGKLTNPDTSGAIPGFIQFDLENCGGNYPIVGGFSITPQQKFNLASDGTWSGTLDINDQIGCNGDTASNWWHISYFVNFRQVGPARDIRLTSSNCASSCSVDGITPITVYPTIAAPTGDSTYLRLDGGNVGNLFSTFWASPGPLGATTPNSGKFTDLITSSTPVVDVRAFGAKCDGVTNDTTTIQNAINNSPANATILIPGICGISATITLPATTLKNVIGTNASTSGLIALSAIAGDMISKADGAISDRGTIRDLTFNCNQVAQTAMEIISYRQLTVRNLYAKDCTSTPWIFGTDSVITNLVGLNAYNVNVDNTALISGLGAAARPNYGIEWRKNVDDSTFDVGIVNHTKIAGFNVEGVNDKITGFHPWGYGPSGTLPFQNTWPNYGIQCTSNCLSLNFSFNEIDQVNLAGIKMSGNRIVALGNEFTTAEANAPYLVESDNGTDTLELAGSILTGGWSGPINFLGTHGTNITAFANGFLTQTYFPTSIQFQGLSIKNSADAALFPICDSGSTSSFTCAWSFRDRGTDKWQVGKFGSNDFRIRSVADSLDIFQAFGGSTVSLSAPSGQVLAFNIQTGSSANGASFYSGGGSPAVVATVSGTGKGTFNGGLVAAGTAAGLTGTGACATITTQLGGLWAGTGKCTGTTGASTLIITPGFNAPNGWICNVQDETTRANLFQQTSHAVGSCTLTITSVTQNDVFVFSAIAF